MVDRNYMTDMNQRQQVNIRTNCSNQLKRVKLVRTIHSRKTYSRQADQTWQDIHSSIKNDNDIKYRSEGTHSY